MIVLDTSAVVAMMLMEASAPRLAARLVTDTDRAMSVATYIEVGTVLAGRRPHPRGAIGDLDAFVAEFTIELRPVDEAQARIAFAARVRYGRGMGHGGVLNFGDTFSCALAKSLDAPLLYVGGDFTTTDIVSALG
jgi:ribonuclease VapC